jgi:hypothetical protein
MAHSWTIHFLEHRSVRTDAYRSTSMGAWQVGNSTGYAIIKVQQDRQVLEVQEVLESCCLVQHIL